MTQPHCPSPPADAELLAAARDGSAEAFRSLALRYQPRLAAVLDRYTRNRHDTEDLVQETLLRAYDNLGRYDERWAVSTWLYRIAINLAISQRRRRQPRTNHDGAGASLTTVADEEPVAQAAQREQAGRVWSIAREQLSAEQHAMLWLAYVEQMPMAEIAAAMGKSRVAVKVAMHRARQRLAEHLAQEEP